MKTSIKLCGLAAAVLMATAGSAMASDTVIPYVLDSQNKVVTNSTGLCWRTSFWTPALAEQGGPDGYGLRQGHPVCRRLHEGCSR